MHRHRIGPLGFVAVRPCVARNLHPHATRARPRCPARQEVEMTKHVCTVCGAIAIAGMTAMAQTPQPSTPSQPSTQPSSSQPAAQSDTRTVTFTGCLARGSAGSTTAASGSSSQFVLNNAQAVSKASTPSSAPAASSAASSAAASSYILKAQGAGVDLSQHVNHKIQVTGTLDSMSTPRTGSSTSPPSSTDPSRPSDQSSTQGQAATPTLNVTAVTMVSSSCS